MKVYNSSKNNLIADDVKAAQNFFARSFGLLSRKSISDGEGLIIKPCCSIHTFFMKFSIDVLFIERNGNIIALYQNVQPWRILPIHLNSHYVIELASGTICAKNIEKGNLITISP